MFDNLSRFTQKHAAFPVSLRIGSAALALTVAVLLLLELSASVRVI